MNQIPAFLTMIGLAGLVPLNGQDQPPLRHEVAVSLKLIQVYVTDKAGKPATNLSKDDFRVLDNGRPQTITDFERNVLSNEMISPAVKPERIATLVPEAKLGRKFFIIIDQEANDLVGISKARMAVNRLIDQAMPTDEIGLLSYSSMAGIVQHAYLTTNHEFVREALKRVRDAPGRSENSPPPMDKPLLIATSLNEPPIALAPPARAGLSSLQMFTNRMMDLAKALRYIPGFKNILFFSQGTTIEATDGESVQRLDSMRREFNTANAPIFTINTEILDPYPPKGTVPLEKSGGELLSFMSKGTGGKAYSQRGAIDAFPSIADDLQTLTRNYYVLGYPVQESWDGKYHKTKVELTAEGYIVQAQSGYNNPKPFKEYSAFEKEIHLFDLALSEKPRLEAPLIFPMIAAAFCPPSADTGRLLLAAMLPPSVIKKFEGRSIELITLILDEQDRAIDRIRLKPKLAGVSDRLPLFAADSSVPPGMYRCRIILRDLETGDAAMAYARAEMPLRKSPPMPRMDTPLLLTPGSGAVLIEGIGKKSLTWKDYYSVDDRTYSPITGELPPGLSEITISIPYSYLEASPTESPDFWASLVAEKSGASLPMELRIEERFSRSDGGTAIGKLAIEGIPKGSYRLYVYQKASASSTPTYQQIPLLIR